MLFAATQPPPTPSRRLRVLFALPGLHRVTRGAEVAFEEIARALAADPGYDVTLVGSGPPRDVPYHYRRAACVARERFERLPSVPYLRGQYAWEELTFAPGLLGAFSPADVDVTVTCGYPYTNWALRMRRGHGRRPRHVFVTQNGDWVVQARNWEFKHFSCDGLVCTNPEYFERHRDRYPCALIPNGVDLDRFHPGEGDRVALGLPKGVPVILIVAALIASKRVREAMRAAAKVAEAHLVIAGDGELRDEVRSLGTQLMPGRFTLRTFGREQMPNLYRCADVLLHLSTDEPFGNVYLEATASGIPVVAHDSATTRWMLEETAALVDTADEGNVVEAIRPALSSRDAAAVIRRRELVERRFGWGEIGRKYGEFFAEVCHSK